MRISTRTTAALLAVWLLSGCTYHLSRVQEPGRAVGFTTGGTWSSLIYAARTDAGGVILVDLGWGAAEKTLAKRLRTLGATPGEVTDVFLTHSHRDHIGAWRAVQGARFHLAAAEVPLFVGDSAHHDFPSRAGTGVLGHAGPVPGEVTVVPFSRDTVFAFGRDTVRAFLVPGHTAGHAAYLFRGVLFVGDATARKITGFKGADPLFSADTERNRESLRSLFERVRGLDVRWACNAHGKCARPDSAYLARVLR